MPARSDGWGWGAGARVGDADGAGLWGLGRRLGTEAQVGDADAVWGGGGGGLGAQVGDTDGLGLGCSGPVMSRVGGYGAAGFPKHGTPFPKCTYLVH